MCVKQHKMRRMAEGNGEIPIEEVPGKDSDIGRTPDYRKLIDYGLDPKVRLSYLLLNHKLSCIKLSWCRLVSIVILNFSI